MHREAPEDADETSPVDAALEEAGFNAVSVEVLLITGLRANARSCGPSRPGY